MFHFKNNTMRDEIFNYIYSEIIKQQNARRVIALAKKDIKKASIDSFASIKFRLQNEKL